MTHNRYYTAQLFDFLERLSRNNDRQWFAANKEEYDLLRDLWLADVQRLIDTMAQWEPSLVGLSAKKAAYRIYRDTRFSHDKTPYKPYFSASISPSRTRGAHAPGFYLHISPTEGESGLFAGVWMPPAPVLNKLRHAIIDNIEEWDEATDNPAVNAHFPGFWASEYLKTAPKGWPKDHPRIELLRMNDFGKNCELSNAFFLDPQWPEHAAEMWQPLKPFVDFLAYSIDEEV